MEIEILPPVPPQAMNSGKEDCVWEYDQYVESINQREIDVIRERLVKAEQYENMTKQQKIDADNKVESVPQPLTKSVSCFNTI